MGKTFPIRLLTGAKALFAFCIVFTWALRLNAATLWVEAEALAPAWPKAESPELFGGKLILGGKANNTATVRITLPESGNWQVWVRNFSYGGNFRTADLQIDQKKSETFGDGKLPNKKPQPIWEKVTPAWELKAGDHLLTLTAHSPICRLDAFVFTTDPEFTPPESLDALPRLPIDTQNIQPSATLPAPSRKTGLKVLMLCGGRPWVARGTADFLTKAGFAVVNCDSKLLGGLGGSIKVFPSDPVEPVPQNVLPEAFAKLGEYQVLFITHITPKKQALLFTPERVEQLKEFVRNGGGLIINRDAPLAALGDLAPVAETAAPEAFRAADWQVTRDAQYENFAVLPESWGVMAPPRWVIPQKDAAVVMKMNGPAGAGNVFLVQKTYGKGKVLFFNDDWGRGYDSLVQLFMWAYGQPLVAAMVAEAAGKAPEIALEKLLFPTPRQVPHHPIDELEYQLSAVNDQEKSCSEPPEILCQDNDYTIRFANGSEIKVAPTGTLQLAYPGLTEPAVRQLAVPKIELKRAIADGVDKDTYEYTRATVSGQVFAKLTWQVEDVKAEGNTAVIELTANDATRARWVWQAADFILDGRTYAGLGDQFFVVESKLKIGAFLFAEKLRLGKSLARHKLRRFACYAPPRGYAEYDMSKGKRDSQPWGYFSAGQAFSYLAAPAGVYVEFPDYPMSVSARWTRDEGDKEISGLTTINIGMQSAPCSTRMLWRGFAPQAEGDDHNAYIAWPQFIRRRITQKIGTRQQAPLPTATHLNTASDAERDVVIKLAGKCGFMRYAMPICPSAIEKLPDQKDCFAKIGAAGMQTFPWTAGDYTHGAAEELFTHSDWFIRVPKGENTHKLAEIEPGTQTYADERGEIYQYGGHYPVIDLTNPEFQKWYFRVLDAAAANGMTGIYLDMYGKASGNVNYATFPAAPGIEGMLKIAREFDRHDFPVGVEGTNPMFLDTYWYRERLYSPFAGREFCLVGMQPRTDEKGDGFAVDFFRMAMFNCYMYTQLDGYWFNFERVPGEIATVERILKFVPTCKKLAQKIGIPVVRETPFGTSWISDTGAALWFWDEVKSLKLQLPEGYELDSITTADGKVTPISKLERVPAESIVFIRRK